MSDKKIPDNLERRGMTTPAKPYKPSDSVKPQNPSKPQDSQKPPKK